jgi:hypothetical protein
MSEGSVYADLVNLHELDLRFSNYAKNAALLRTGFYDLSKTMVELFTNIYL